MKLLFRDLIIAPSAIKIQGKNAGPWVISTIGGHKLAVTVPTRTAL